MWIEEEEGSFPFSKSVLELILMLAPLTKSTRRPLVGEYLYSNISVPEPADRLWPGLVRAYVAIVISEDSD